MKKIFIIVSALLAFNIIFANIGGFNSLKEYIDSISLDLNNETQRDIVLNAQLNDSDEISADVINAKFNALKEEIATLNSESLNCSDYSGDSSACVNPNCEAISWDYDGNLTGTVCRDACPDNLQILNIDDLFSGGIFNTPDQVANAVCGCADGNYSTNYDTDCFMPMCNAIDDENTCNNVGLVNLVGGDQTLGYIDDAGTLCQWNATSGACEDIGGGGPQPPPPLSGCESITDLQTCHSNSSCYVNVTNSLNFGDIDEWTCNEIINCADVPSPEDEWNDFPNGTGDFWGTFNDCSNLTDSSGNQCYPDNGSFTGSCLGLESDCNQYDEFSCFDIGQDTNGNSCNWNSDSFICETN